MSRLLDGGPRKGAALTNKCKNKSPWVCRNRLTLRCESHRSRIQVSCKRWRYCGPCALRKSWELRDRFVAGIEQVPDSLFPAFITLTFPAASAPDESEAHRCLRSLIHRMRYRSRLTEYGWVLQRQKNGTLHYHGIFWMTWFEDGLDEWRDLGLESGFGPIQRIERARYRDAVYCSRYISSRLAELDPARRAFSFSQGFPRPNRTDERGAGIHEHCVWEPVFDGLPTGAKTS